MVAKGDREADAGHYANAIEHYRNAWRHALQLQLQVALNPDGSTRLQFVGNSSKSYLIEVSTDMVNWVSLGTCTANGDGDVEFTDPNAAESVRPLLPGGGAIDVASPGSGLEKSAENLWKGIAAISSSRSPEVTRRTCAIGGAVRAAPIAFKPLLFGVGFGVNRRRGPAQVSTTA